LRQREQGTLHPLILETASPRIARVAPVQRPVPAPVARDPSERVIQIIDLSDEDTVSYGDYFNPYDPVDEDPSQAVPSHSNDLEVINIEPPELIDLRSNSPINYNSENLNDILTNLQDPEPTLEPLDPEAEYRYNINRMFITIDEYARNAFLTNND